MNVENDVDACELAILGAGPAGLTAAVYAASEGLDTVMLDRAAVKNAVDGPTAEALAAATIVPARLVGADKRTGSIAVGKAADLVLVEGDPSQRDGATKTSAAHISSGTSSRRPRNVTAAAISSGLPLRPIGICEANWAAACSACSGVRPVVVSKAGVSIGPGLIVFTRILKGP